VSIIRDSMEDSHAVLSIKNTNHAGEDPSVPTQDICAVIATDDVR
jgi:hypothetical protein